MLSNKIVPAHILRLYAWEMLKTNGVLSEVTVNGLPNIPVIPVEDEPEFRDSGKAYIIYGWSENEDNSVRPIKRGNIAFRIIAEDTNQLSHITSVLSMGMADEDETATSINWWSSEYPADLKGIRFTWVRTVLVESADPAVSEGGPVEGNVMVSYRYVSSQEPKVYTTDNGWEYPSETETRRKALSLEV